MPADNLFQLFTSRFDSAGIPYMVTGSVASMVYGEPRLTHDVDVVIELASDAQTQALVDAFPEEQFYCAPTEVIQVERRRPMRGHFNVIHHETGFKADVYLMGKDPLHRWAFGLRRKLELDGQDFWVAPPEYVIIRKLEFYREGRSEKHLADIRAILESPDVDLDREELTRRIDERGLAPIWQGVALL